MSERAFIHDRTENGTRPEEEFRLLELATLVLRQWRVILGAVVVTVLVTMGLWLLYPNSYTARTVLILSEQPRTSPAAALLASQLPGQLGGMVGGADATQQSIAVVLKSRTLANAMAARIAGERRTVTESTVQDILATGMQVQQPSDGSIVIQVKAKDPVLAARIANVFPELINAILSRLGAQAALRKQQFLESQLVTARERLVESEQRLLSFQQRSETPEVQEQARRTIEAAARLQEVINQQEIEVSQLRRTATTENPQLRAAVAELNARREQLRRLTAGGGSSDVFIPLRQSPELKVLTTRLLREFTKNEQVYIALTAALADAQIDVSNNLPLVSVLDPAVVPTSPSRTSPKLLFAIALVLGLLLGLVVAFIREHVQRMERTPDNEQFFAAWSRFRGEVASYVPGR